MTTTPPEPLAEGDATVGWAVLRKWRWGTSALVTTVPLDRATAEHIVQDYDGPDQCRVVRIVEADADIVRAPAPGAGAIAATVRAHYWSGSLDACCCEWTPVRDGRHGTIAQQHDLHIAEAVAALYRPTGGA